MTGVKTPPKAALSTKKLKFNFKIRMEGLPKEIIKYIGKFLRPEDQSAFRKTCHVHRKLFAGVFLNINRNRLYLYAQRAIYEKRYDAVDYFFDVLARRHDNDDRACIDTFMRIIESDSVVSMSTFKKHFLQETDWMLRFELWATKLDSHLWGTVLTSIDTFKRLNDCLFYLLQDNDGYDCEKTCMIEKLKVLFQYVNTRFFKWAFCQDKFPIASVIIDEIQFLIDFSCSRRCSEQLQRLYCKRYAGYSNGFENKDKAQHLILFIDATCCIHEDACKALTKSGLHDTIADYCKCEQTSIEFDIRKRLSEVEIENERVTKRIKF